MTEDVAAALAAAEAMQDETVAGLVDLLRIPSVSTDPAYAPHVRRAAEWLATELARDLDEVRVLETSGHPSVWARCDAERADAPTLLLYGHLDVQPVEPSSAWTAPPFLPVVRDGALWARGASDDKGQVWALARAVVAWRRAGLRPPVHVRLLVEGEEEISSPHIDEILTRDRDLVACDGVVLADQPMLDPRTPLVLYGVRGAAYLEVTVRAAATDLHSGTFGGGVDNPAIVLARLLASVADPESRRVVVPGFYDRVLEPPPEERAALAALPVDDALLTAMTGAPASVGEAGWSLAERLSVRPTYDVNGVMAGHTGEGKKSVIPATATAKLGFRLVPGQEPAEVTALVREHLLAQAPPSVTVEVADLGGSRPALMPRDSWVVRAADAAYRGVLGRGGLFMRGGGSEPVVPAFQELLGVPVAMIGFGLPDDGTHAPDEHLLLSQLHTGVEVGVHLLATAADAWVRRVTPTG